MNEKIFTDGYNALRIDIENAGMEKVNSDGDHISRVYLLDNDYEIIYSNGDNKTVLNGKAGQILVCIYRNDNYTKHACFLLDCEELKDNILAERAYYKSLKEKQGEAKCEECDNAPIGD